MLSSINLASAKKPEQRHVQKLLVISIVVFAGVFLFSASLLGYFLYIRGQISKLIEEEESVVAQINAVPQQKVNALVLKDRIANVSKILGAQGNVNSQIENVLTLIPDSLDISAFEINGKNVTVELQSSDLALFHTFLEEDILKVQSLTKSFLTKSDVSAFNIQDSVPRYSMEVTFELTE